MRRVSFATVLLTAISVSAGAAASSEPPFAVASLPRLVAPKPPLPKNAAWHDLTTSDGDSRAFDLQSSWLFDPGPLMNAMQRAGFQRGYRRLWDADELQPYDYRTAVASALLFRTVGGARAALAALRGDDLTHARDARVLRWGEFGNDSLGLTRAGEEPYAFYEWRVRNVVLIAQAYCDVACTFDDVVPVTRAYARALDLRAKRTS